jgi:hypothetical protein
LFLLGAAIHLRPLPRLLVAKSDVAIPCRTSSVSNSRTLCNLRS